MKLFGWACTVLLLGGSSYLWAQEHTTLTRWSHPELDRINKLVDTRKYQEAIDRSLSGATRMKDEGNWEGYISFMLRAAEIETFEVWKAKGFPEANITEDYHRPLRYLQDLYNTAGERIRDYPYLEANALFTSAVVYDLLSMPDTAEQMHLRALQMRTQLYGDQSREVADSHLWLGVVYNWGLQRKDLAEQHYLKAMELQKRYMPESRYALGSVYYGLATIARKNYRFDEVETMANLYLSLYGDLPYQQAFAYQVVANMYFIQGDFERSKQMRERSLEIYDASGYSQDLIEGYFNLSSDLRAMGRYAESRKALASGLRLWERTEPRNPAYVQLLYAHLGDLYWVMGKYDSAAFYLDRAIDRAVSMHGAKNGELAQLYDVRGKMYLDKGDYRQALADFRQAIASILPDSVPEGPVIREENPYFATLISAYFNTGDAYVKWYGEDHDSEHLEHALEYYRAAYGQMIIARQNIGDDLSKTFLMSNFSRSIERSIQCARVLYNKAGEARYFEDALHFVELTKYLNVLEALGRAERANNSGIPKSLLFELEEVRSELNLRQRMRLTATTLPSDSIRRMNEEVVALINRRRELMTRISGYPGYTVSTVGDLLVTLGQIQEQLDDDEQLLEYYWGTDSIYVLSITDKASAMMALPREEATDTLITTVYKTISGQPRFGPIVANAYGDAADKVYQKFFAPAIRKRRVVVVPDGPLSMVPLEALVTFYLPSPELTFRDLNYVLYDHEVSYAYSSTILFKDRTRQRGRIENVLAFSYSGGADPSYLTRRSHGDELPGTYVELETLSRLYEKVTRFTNGAASKQNFINNSAGYDLIHLGVHGVGDEEVADNSRLIFRGDSMSDRTLYAYEIYNLKLNAGLVVLSACETGIGRNIAGEGVLSIARAFTYAGCPSVVMSLWDVPDAFTSTIMTRFYENLNDAQSVSASLRDAKLKFLEESDPLTAHPAHWAAFVVNGQDVVFRTSDINPAVYVIGALLIGGAGVLLYRRRRAGKRRQV
ncbi:MAG: CHAT domain-containing protein [Bacteroidota bacterium]